MDHWEGLSTVFNHWYFCFKIIIHWWATVDFVTQDGPFFHEIFKIFVVINQKLCGVWDQKLVWVVNTIGTTNTPSFVKIREVTQNSLLIWHGMTLIALVWVTHHWQELHTTTPHLYLKQHVSVAMPYYGWPIVGECHFKRRSFVCEWYIICNV